MKTTKEMIEVMKAFEEGKKIEFAIRNSNSWSIADSPSWNWWCNDYRVKADPVYRPYKDIEEMIDDVCNRFSVKRTRLGGPFIWVKDKDMKIKRLISGYDQRDNTVLLVTWTTLKDMFNNYTYLDGSPYGIKED